MKSATPITSSQNDALDPARAAALVVMLGLPDQTGTGTALPPFFHQLYFWAPEPAGRLGRDGHPKVGGIIPDMGLPRRMWAGGRLEFHADLIAGQPAKRISICEDHKRKSGRSGPLGFVTLRHEVWQDDELKVTEWQDLVYREDHRADASPVQMPMAPIDEETAQPRSFTTTELFRYSALTFNGHRIHYDLEYAKEVEGYDGLVVHGPLLAQLLMLKARTELGPLERFAFRATAPLMHYQTATLCRKGRTLWVRGPDGQQCMSAEA